MGPRSPSQSKLINVTSTFKFAWCQFLYVANAFVPMFVVVTVETERETWRMFSKKVKISTGGKFAEM